MPEPSSPASTPLVVALVLNWCAEEDTLACVASLEDQLYPALRICVLDNASPDGSGARLQRELPQHHFIQTGANLGYAGGNAVGIAWALEQGSEHVLVVNDDAVLHPGCLQALVDVMQRDPRVGMAAPTIVHRDMPDRTWWAGGHLARWKVMGEHPNFGELPPATNCEPRDVDFVSGCVLLLRAAALRECGGFDAAFVSYGEDVELSLRFASAGWRLVHVPAARAAHAVTWPPPPSSPWALAHLDRNRRRIAARHLGAIERAVFAAWFYPTRALLAAGALLKRDPARARAYWRGALSSLAER